MTQELSKDDVRSVADLAHISLSDTEVEKFQKDLGSILGYFDKLAEVDTEDVMEMGHITGLENVYREDSVCEASQEQKNAIINNVPQKSAAGHIAVKNVL